MQKMKTERELAVARAVCEINLSLALGACKRLGLMTWECKAKKTADPPQDCDWPTCGCDRYADRVIEALQESGKFDNALQSTNHSALLEIHRTVHSWADVPTINEHDQWTVKRVKELLLAYQAVTKPPGQPKAAAPSEQNAAGQSRREMTPAPSNEGLDSGVASAAPISNPCWQRDKIMLRKSTNTVLERWAACEIDRLERELTAATDALRVAREEISTLEAHVKHLRVIRP